MAVKKERRKRRRLLKIAGGILAEALLMRLRGYVTPVRDVELNADERRGAHERKDVRLP